MAWALLLSLGYWLCVWQCIISQQVSSRDSPLLKALRVDGALCFPELTHNKTLRASSVPAGAASLPASTTHTLILCFT